jgi:two-component system, NarL family, sensor histidine kinase UhpB
MPFFSRSAIIDTKTLSLASVLCLVLSVTSYGQSAADSFSVGNLLAQTDKLTKQAVYDSAIATGQRALSISQKANYKRGQAMAYDRLSEIMLLNGKMKEVRHYDSLVMPMATQLKDTTLLVSAHNRSGVYYMEKGLIKDAEQSFTQALNMGLEKDQSIKTAEVYSNKASLLLALGDKDKAMEWFFKALRLYEKNNSETGQGETYSNISSVFYLLGKTDDAIDYQKKSIYLRERLNDIPGLAIANINIGQLYILKDSMPRSLQHLQKAVRYAEQIRNPKLMASSYSGMSTFYSRSKDFKSALEWQAKAIKIFEETDNKPLLSRQYVSAGLLASATKDSAAAVNYFMKALSISKQLGNKENIGNAYEKLSNFYLSHQEYKHAYDHYKQFITYRDSIKESSTLTRIEEIRTKYETEKKDNEIARLNTEQRIRQLEIEKQKAIIDGNNLVAQQKENQIQLLSQQQELRDARIEQQEKELERQMLLAKNSQQELDKQMLLAKNSSQALKLAEQDKQLKDKQLESQKLLRNLIIGAVILLGALGFVLFNRYQLKKKLQQQNALLAVRNNIARDLHDEIGSTLTSIRILSEVSQNNLQKDQQKTSRLLNKITEQSSQMQQGMSDIVWAIKPDNDKLENMLVRMREYVSHTLESKNIQTIFSIDEEALSQSLNMQQRRDFFLIFKEAVNNAAKYSQATKVEIRIAKEKGQLLLDIVDNGVGFIAATETSSNGLKNMKARAEAMLGSVNITSEPGSGTIVSAIVPATS